jgi:hypothetical protein
LSTGTSFHLYDWRNFSQRRAPTLKLWRKRPREIRHAIKSVVLLYYCPAFTIPEVCIKVNMKLSSFGLFLPVLLSALYAGIGFFVIMGGNPSILKMSDRTFAEYWQHVDFYMAARMKIFGPLLLLSVLALPLLHLPEWQTLPFWLFVLALLILVVDIITFASINHPLNGLIQSWDLNNLPDNVTEIKNRVVYGFWIRSACMIGSFVCILLAIFLRKKI